MLRSVLVSLTLGGALCASMGAQWPRWKDHHFRVSGAARNAVAKKATEIKESRERKRELMTVENEFGPGYYYGGSDSSHWKKVWRTWWDAATLCSGRSD